MPRMPSSMVDVSLLHHAHLRDHRTRHGTAIKPLTLILKNKQAADVRMEDVEAAFVGEIGEAESTNSKVVRCGVETNAYYEAFYASGDTRYTPFTIVKIWYI